MMLEFNEFDSGILAAKVGTVNIPNSAEGSLKNTLKSAIEQGKEAGYDLISVVLPYEVSVDGWGHVGSLVKLEGTFSTALDRLSRFIGRCNVKEIGKNDRDDISIFVRDNLAENRFTKDPRIAHKDAVRQKLKILDTYLQDGAIGYLARHEGNLVGFHLSYVRDDGVVTFYEIEVKPSARNGFLAFDLVGSTLKHLEKISPELKLITTQIYDDNLQSLNLFSKLGMLQTDEEKCHYHCWPKHV